MKLSFFYINKAIEKTINNLTIFKKKIINNNKTENNFQSAHLIKRQK